MKVQMHLHGCRVAVRIDLANHSRDRIPSFDREPKMPAEPGDAVDPDAGNLGLTARRPGRSAGYRPALGSPGITIEVLEYDPVTSSLVTVVPARHWDAPFDVPALPLSPPECVCQRCSGAK